MFRESPSKDTVQELLRRFAAHRIFDHSDEFQREALLYFDSLEQQPQTCEGYRTRFIDFQGRWWVEYLYSPEIRNWFDQKLKDAFGSRDMWIELADEFVSSSLSRNRFYRLRRCRGIVCRRKFVRTVLGNLLHDYQRKIYGRPRPPKAVSTLGNLHMRLFRLLCVEQRHEEEAIVLVLSADNSNALNKSDVRKAIRKIRAIVPDCGTTSKGKLLDSAGYDVDSLPLDDDPAEIADITKRFPEILMDLLLDYTESDKQKRKKSDDFAGQLQHAIEQLHLSDEEQLLLRKYYVEGKDLSIISLELRRTESEIRLEIDLLRTRIRAVLTDFGLDFDDPEGGAV